jgi:Cu/Ag efflux pump CusA
LAIGVIVDNGIIMSENAYKLLSQRYAEVMAKKSENN